MEPKDSLLRDHPLAEDIRDIAERQGIDIEDVSSIPTVLSQLEGPDHSDPGVILLLALLLEAFVNHKERLVLQDLIDRSSSALPEEEESERD